MQNFRFEIDGIRTTRITNLRIWPKAKNGSTFVSYDGGGQTVQSQYPFSLDYIGHYRYEIRNGQEIVRVDPYDNQNQNLIYNSTNASAEEFVSQIEYDSFRDLVYFTSENLFKNDTQGQWFLKMINLSSLDVQILESNLSSPAIAFYQLGNETDGPAVLFLKSTGLWAMNASNNESEVSLLIGRKELNAGDLRKVTHIAADPFYFYYVNGTDSGLHLFDWRDKSTKTISLALAPFEMVSSCFV